MKLPTSDFFFFKTLIDHFFSLKTSKWSSTGGVLGCWCTRCWPGGCRSKARIASRPWTRSSRSMSCPSLIVIPLDKDAYLIAISYWPKIWSDSEPRPNWECQPSWVLRLNRYCALSSRGTQPTGLDQGPMGLRTSRWKRLSISNIISKQCYQSIFLLLGAHLLLLHWLGATC